MSLRKFESYQIILTIIALITIGMGVMIWILPPSIFPDPSWGFQVMRCMQMGGGFNMLTVPNPDDISTNTTSFLSWWSPGQYLTPYLLKIIFGFNTGRATSLTIILCNISGLTGFYYFFKKAGFAKLTAALGLAFIVLQEAFWMPFAYYNGGEVLLFAFEGWFLYGCIALKKADVKLIVFILLSGLIGFFCKSSFMWIFISGLLYLWLSLSKQQTAVWVWLKNGILIGVPAIISLGIIYGLYLSKGENPASMYDGFKLRFEAIGFPIASPLLAGFSVDDLLNGLIFSDTPYPHTQMILILLVLIVLSVALIISIIRYVPHKEYKLLLIVFYGMSVLFFSYSFLRQAVISYEARHFRMIGLLIAPGIVYLVQLINKPYRVIFLLFCVVIGTKSAKYIYKTPQVNKSDARGNTGIAQQFIDQPALDYILALDKQKTNVLFVFVSADIGLEIQHNRIITITDNTVPYIGHAGPVYLMAPVWDTPKQIAALLKNFPGYTNFTATRISNRYMLYTAQ